MKRLLSCTSSEMLKMDGQELKQAILASEGRTVMTETVVAIEPLLGDLTNAELAVSFGSDMVLLNCFDCNNPEIKGLPECDNPVEKLKEIVISALKQASLYEEVKNRLKDSALGLSGGQQQRLCIARCIAMKPDVILMDEPTSALDPIATLKIENLIQELKNLNSFL